tara:strand:- start:206 stop:487 length:282 start_codon:yes stop_codon:yes gene_type:complete
METYLTSESKSTKNDIELCRKAYKNLEWEKSTSSTPRIFTQYLMKKQITFLFTLVTVELFCRLEYFYEQQERTDYENVSIVDFLLSDSRCALA